MQQLQSRYNRPQQLNTTSLQPAAVSGACHYAGDEDGRCQGGHGDDSKGTNAAFTQLWLRCGCIFWIFDGGEQHLGWESKLVVAMKNTSHIDMTYINHI